MNALLAGALAVAPALEGAPVAIEEFVYPDGPLDQQNGGTGWTSQWFSAETIFNPGLTYFDGQDSLVVAGGGLLLSEKSSATYRTLSIPLTRGSTFYISFVAEIRSGDSVGVLLNAGKPGRVFIGKNSTGANWEITDFIGNESVSSIPASMKSFLVLRLDVSMSGLNTVSLYVNPPLAQEPANADAWYATNEYSNLENVFLQGIGSSLNPVDAVVAELRFGATYCDVAPIAPPALTISSVSRSAGGDFVINGRTRPGTDVNIEAAPDLAATFAKIGTTISDANGNFEYNDAGASELSQRFYRATFP